MEGLEASILLNSDLENLQTIGSEFYRREYVEDQEQLRSSGLELEQLSDACSLITDGDHGVADYQDEGVPFLLSENVKEGWIDTSSLRKISEAHHRLLRRSQIKQGDVLVTKTGVYFGKSAVFDLAMSDANTIAHVGILRPKRHIDPYLLSTFLNSRHGQSQLRRRGIKATRPEIKLVEFQDIEFPVFSPAVAIGVKNLVITANRIRREVDDAISAASARLVSLLGLADWTPPEPLSYRASAADVFSAGRIDAQYFMPAKEQVRQSLAALPGELLSERVDSIREQWVPSRAAPTMRVRNYDVTDALDPLLDIEKEPTVAAEIGSMKKVLKDGDVAISRLRAYLKEIAVVRTGDGLPSVGSSEFIVLRPKNNAISPETLMVFLRSTPVQTILKWCQDGSQHPRFSESDLLSIPVPDAVADASPEITEIVRDGFAARKRARILLDAAKRAVEIAIEDGEPSAFAYLDTVEGET